MKTILLLLSVVGVVAPAVALEKAMPEPFAEDRYQAMIARSPFGLATPVAAPVIQDKSFAEGWFLSGVSQVDGKNLVHVRSRDQSVQFILHGDEPNKQEGLGFGVKLQNVEWSPTLGRTSATIEKDGQFAKIELSNQPETGAAGPLGGAGMNPNPGARPQISANPAIRPAGATAYPQPGGLPQQRNVIPRPSGQPITPPQPTYQITPGAAPKNGLQLNTPGTAPAAPATEGRRRIRMIPAQPTQ